VENSCDAPLGNLADCIRLH